MFLLLMALAGLIVGLARGGKLHNFLNVRFRGWQFLVAAFGIQLIIFSNLPHIGEWALSYGAHAYVLSLLLVLTGIALNFRHYGFPVVLLGAFGNFLAIASNGGHMPAPAGNLLRATDPETVEAVRTAAYFSNSTIMGDDTRFWFLGDIFLLPPPFPLPNVFSIGDVLIGLGVFLFLQHSLLDSRTSIRDCSDL